LGWLAQRPVRQSKSKGRTTCSNPVISWTCTPAAMWLPREDSNTDIEKGRLLMNAVCSGLMAALVAASTLPAQSPVAGLANRDRIGQRSTRAAGHDPIPTISHSPAGSILPPQIVACPCPSAAQRKSRSFFDGRSFALVSRNQLGCGTTNRVRWRSTRPASPASSTCGETGGPATALHPRNRSCHPEKPGMRFRASI